MLAAAAMAALPAGAPAGAQPLQAVPFDSGRQPLALNRQRLRYASRQGWISLLVPRRDRPPPLVIWLNGADFGRDASRYSTEWLPDFLFENGYALATVTTSRPQRIGASGVLEESVAALRELVAQAERYGYDPSRIILMGRGAGGQLAALFGTDLRLLEEAGLAPDAVRAVLVINGDGFDLSERLADSTAFRRRLYDRMLGPDPSLHRRLSPATYVEAPNAALFLLYATDGLSDFAAQAEAFGAQLRQAGAGVEIRRLQPSLDSAARKFGAPQNPETALLADTLGRVLGAD